MKPTVQIAIAKDRPMRKRMDPISFRFQGSRQEDALCETIASNDACKT
jgi:hypothetical protein